MLGAGKRHVKSGDSPAVLFIVSWLRDGLGHPLSDCTHVAIDALDALVCVLAARQLRTTRVHLFVRLLRHADLVVARLAELLWRLSEFRILLWVFGNCVSVETVTSHAARTHLRRVCAAHMILPLRAAFLAAPVRPEVV